MRSKYQNRGDNLGRIRVIQGEESKTKSNINFFIQFLKAIKKQYRIVIKRCNNIGL